MALPVFVIGRNRSGTTWLANQLCEHPRIAGVQHERHHAIHESAYFGWIDGRYGDLSERVNHAEFVEVMAASDFFRLAGATKEFLYSLWPTTYEGVFRAVMDRFAQERGADAWVEKAGVQEEVMHKVAACYPDARVVAIVREVEANVASAVANPRALESYRWRWLAVARAACGWVYHRKAVCAFARRHPDRVHVVYYEQMKSDLAGTMRGILAFLGLEWDDRVLGQTYKPNSTFKDEKARRQALASGERKLVRFIAALARLVPRGVLGLPDRMRHRRHPKQLPIWFFRLQPFFKDDPRQYDALYGHTGMADLSANRPPSSDALT